MPRGTTAMVVLAALVGTTVEPISAQPHPEGAPPGGPDFVVTAAGERYGADGLHRWLLGPHHRDLWVEPVAVRVLSLDATAGGLTPVKTGGGMQTRSLRLRGADGREYTFRSVDKDPAAILDPIYRGTILADIVQDGISAAHPFGALVTAPLLDVAGVLHAEPYLRVMPDDPALGPFRTEFAGMLGILEERPDEHDGGAAAFAGARKVIGSERLMERISEGPHDRVAAGAYLKARLMDVFLGDWDRHRDQWRWATFDAEEPRIWLPIPRDRDQVFSDFDGVATDIARLYVPQLVEFGPTYPSMVRLHWNGRAIDRRFLAGLDREAWDLVGHEIVSALTDAVIDDAVLRLPPEIHAIDGAELASTLKARRDALPDAWGELYGLMAEQVDVHGTDAEDVVTVELAGEGTVVVTIGDGPWFRRTFVAEETREIRLHLLDGADRVLVSGDVDPGLTVRIVGGPGNDRYEIRGAGAGIRLYDHEGDDVLVGTDAHQVDRRPYRAWSWTPDDRDQPRDWGRRTTPTLWSSYGSDVGPFVGVGARMERYGFRNLPFASAIEIRGGFAPTLGTGRLELEAIWNRANSPVFWAASARYSGLDVLHYYGPGNASAPGDETFHRAELGRASASTGVGISPVPWLRLSGEVGIRHASTRRPEGDRFLSTLDDVYGGGGFTTLALGGRLVLDPFEASTRTAHRFRFDVEATLHPAALDAEEAFGRARASVSALIAPSDEPAWSLALRAGTEQVLGRFPWHESAFIGGQGTVRGWSDQRFAGDAAVYASGEMRVRVMRPTLVVPTAVGAFGFFDRGRVWEDGRSPGGWHDGVGGGLFLQPAGQPYIARLGAATSRETTKLFVTVGLPY